MIWPYFWTILDGVDYDVNIISKEAIGLGVALLP